MILRRNKAKKEIKNHIKKLNEEFSKQLCSVRTEKEARDRILEKKTKFLKGLEPYDEFKFNDVKYTLFDIYFGKVVICNERFSLSGKKLKGDIAVDLYQLDALVCKIISSYKSVGEALRDIGYRSSTIAQDSPSVYAGRVKGGRIKSVLFNEEELYLLEKGFKKL